MVIQAIRVWLWASFTRVHTISFIRVTGVTFNVSDFFFAKSKASWQFQQLLNSFLAMTSSISRSLREI